MKDESYTTSFTVDQTPAEVFAAFNNVRGWWSESVEGITNQLGAEFRYWFQDVHRCRLKVTELVPGERVSWLVLDNYFSFTDDRTEWTGTQIVLDITTSGEGTDVRFTHQGLVPAYECYDACMDGWNTYIGGSLRSLITTGKGNPNVGEPITGREQSLSGGRS